MKAGFFFITLFASVCFGQSNVTEPPIKIKPSYNVALVMYEGFTMFDLLGPTTVFGKLNSTFKMVTVGKEATSNLPSQTFGQTYPVALSIKDALKLSGDSKIDMMVIPGALLGFNKVLLDSELISDIRKLGNQVDVLFSVCTGAVIMAKTGLYDGIDATTNKQAYHIYTPLFPKVNWKLTARWVHEKSGKIVSSSGVSSGVDAALYIVSRILGKDKAQQVANSLEYNAHWDPSDDPFAF